MFENIAGQELKLEKYLKDISNIIKHFKSLIIMYVLHTSD